MLMIKILKRDFFHTVEIEIGDNHGAVLKLRFCSKHTSLVEVDFHSSRTAQARDTHSRLPGCTGEFQTHPETVINK